MRKYARIIQLASLGWLGLVLSVFGFALPARGENPTPPILVTETQTGGLNTDGTEDPKAEFVELYNAHNEAVALDGWQVEFLTKAHDGVSAPTRVLASLSGIIEPGQFVIISYDQFVPGAQFYFSGGPASGYLAKGDGTVRIRNNHGAATDILGWGSPSNYAGQPVSAAGSGFSLQRCFNGDTIASTGNNRNDFAAYAPTPGQAAACSQQEPPSEPDNPDNGNPPAAPGPDATRCHDILVNELLPNPSGSDAGREFIEIHNPTAHPVPLQGCSLQTSANTRVFSFNVGDILLPGEYRALHDSATGLTLPNSQGGTVWLLSSAEEIQSVTYAPGLDDDVAWALFEDQWAATYVPTPNTANQLAEQKPCATGQERSASSGRCVTPATTTQPAPCKEGQERNPATNRCRSATTSSAELKPCAPNQVRNPQTNRCRSADSPDGPAPCADGYERNPQTNRCRKTAANTDAPAVYDIPVTQTGSTAGLWIAGAGVAGALGYGVYEWRSEIGNFIRKMKDFFSTGGTP